ncbi:ABC transporter permease [Ilumatobacter sp.]|uniref:ABC transporter permease n=1 Tax=Ilumatobacter sp. TaxID=1967498 RepID=UPI003B518387
MRFWAQRIGGALLVLVAVSAITFGAMNVLGDPLFNILGPTAGDVGNPESVAKIEAAKEQFNLDDPLPVRYALWVSDFVRGDFGPQFSATGQPPVSDLVLERVPRSVMLLVMAQLLATAIAIPWALWSASRADSFADRTSTIASFFIIAIPTFALGVLLKYLFSIRFAIFPLTFRATDPFWSRVWQMFLPALTLALPVGTVYQRLLRTDLITTLQEDFILTARSKGVSRRDVLFKHALRPSLFSFITIFGINTGTLIGGSLVVEIIFRIPGLGTAIVESILREDFPVVLTIVMLVTAVFVVLNVAIDILYSFIDPRVRSS